MVVGAQGMSISILGSGFFFMLTAGCLLLAERHRGEPVGRQAARASLGFVVVAGILLAADVPFLGALMDPYHAKRAPKKAGGGGGGGGDVGAGETANQSNGGGGGSGSGGAGSEAAAASEGSASGEGGHGAEAGAGNAVISQNAAAAAAEAAAEKADRIAELAACNDLPDLVAIPAGIGRIGAPADEPSALIVEKPEREVRVWPSFSITRNEISYQQYKCFTEATQRPWRKCPNMPMPQKTARLAGSQEIDPQALHVPATCLAWEDAKAYAAWLSRRTGRVFRLPTALEWEYAARAGERDAESGIVLDEATAKARRLFNMSGGVAEFVSDCWISRKKEANGKEANGAQDDIDQAAQPSLCPTHVLKDAPLDDGKTRKPWSRRRALAGIVSESIGFRVIRTN